MDVLTTAQVEDESWDYLMILDACRFDYFSQIYRDYLSGRLTKRLSLGSSTPEWFANSFRRRHSDVVYVSGNPFINGLSSNSRLEAVRFFCKVVDVWDFGWNEELGMVHPQEINKAALKAIQEFPSHRFIIHYLQPHAPYISTRFQIRGFKKPKIETKRSNLFVIRNYGRLRTTLYHYVDKLGANLAKVGILRCEWTIREVLGMPPFSPMDAVRRECGSDGLRLAYEENLRTVLRHVLQLCSYLLVNVPGKKIVVTSDHGERLGDNGQYGHVSGSNDPLLREIPWFEVSGLPD